MPRGTHLTDKEKGGIAALFDKQTSKKEIARSIKRSPKAVRNYLKNPNSVSCTKRTGRPPILSPRDIRRAFHLACVDGLTAGKISSLLSVPCNRSTVTRALHATENASYIKRKSAPYLVERHKVARLAFAQDRVREKCNWDNVLFSDEKKFNFDGPDGCQYYWADKRIEPQTYSKRVGGGGSVMVWGGMCRYGTTKLCFLEGKQNSFAYSNTLESTLIPFIEKMREHDPSKKLIFQQDGASIHTSAHSKGWLARQDIEPMPWPAKSPDLSPIENLWGDLVRSVYANGRQYTAKADLKQAITIAWREVTSKRLEKLIDSMPGRIFDVGKQKGGAIDK
jgi:DDE superfamily endonuclease/Tc3 transposase